MADPGPMLSPERVIDFPLEELPSIDEHGMLVLAPVPVVWQALLAVTARGFSGRASGRVARALECSHTETSGPIDRIGSTVPGFIVARVVAPAVLALEGQHRFSRYGLIFSLEPTRDEQTLLRAESRAEFPGIKGKAYQGLVIGTRAHVVVVNRLLRRIKRRAEKTAPPPSRIDKGEEAPSRPPS